jgi:CheY-like chemotaxis protein
LLGWGYAVQVVYDAPSALADADTSHPDVILSDINMPGMDGFRLAEELAGKGVSLIATTGYGDEANRQQSYEVGFQHHFVKPVDLNGLHSVLEQYRKAG